MLHGLLKRLIRVGDLRVRLPNGRVERYGDATGTKVLARLSARGVRRIAFNPQVGLGDAYMEGDLVIEEGGLWDLFEIVGRNQGGHVDPPGMGPVRRLLHPLERALQRANDRRAAKRNVSHHYDLSNELYRRFLDQDMQYSCAYFARPDMTLDEAQAAKRLHLASKLRLEPGMKVLDIGCGWGGLALELAGRWGVDVLGVTLSEEQLFVARRRAEAAGLSDRARFSLTDFRDVAGPFDRIVSVGMFEHVGAHNFREFFQSVRRLLAEDGLMVLHSIGRRDPPGATNAWTRRHIFPGAYVPALSETLATLEELRLWVTDIEVLRLHYAETLRHWRARFMAERGAIAELYDERFCRMWEYYLAASEFGFRYGDHMVFQMQLARKVDAVPITRDYMFEAERDGPVQAIRAAE